MKVENIQLVERVIDPASAPESIREAAKKFTHLIPALRKKVLSFDLIDSNEAFANALRRVFMDELEVKALSFSVHDITTDDKYILPASIQHRIRSVPLVQSIPETHAFKLLANNKTRDIQVVHMGDLVCKPSGVRPWFNVNIPICTLRPNKFLSIHNIKVDKGVGYDDNIFSIGSFGYKCLDADFSKMSLEQELTQFRIEFRTNGNIEAVDLVSVIASNLKTRLKEIQMLVDAYNIDRNVASASIMNDKLYIVKNMKAGDDAVYEIHINKEYHTIGNLLSKYIYLEDKTIDFNAYKLDHVLHHKVIVFVKHVEYKKIMHVAIDAIINDIDTWQTFIYNKLS